MITYKVKRIELLPQSTLGILLDGDDNFLCFTLEDTVREKDKKVKGATAIPTGTYRVSLRAAGGMHQRYSERFKDIHNGMLWVRDVPGFEWIYLHVGNTIADTDGCILVGDGTNFVNGERILLSSVQAYRRVYPKMAALARDGKLLLEVL